jgi:hypothetical protein
LIKLPECRSVRLPTCSSRFHFQLTHEMTFSNRGTFVTEDVICGGSVEKEVGK